MGFGVGDGGRVEVLDVGVIIDVAVFGSMMVDIVVVCAEVGLSFVII